MSADGVRDRVEAFITDFYDRWQRSGTPADPYDVGPAVFEAWTAELAELAATHGIEGFRTGAEGSLSNPSPHIPGAEQVTTIEAKRTTAVVRTVAELPWNNTRYYEYRLRLVDGDWRLTKLRSFLDPPGKPLLEKAAAQALLASARPDALLEPLTGGDEIDVDLLFTPGRIVQPFGDPASIEVTTLGELVCRSGVLAALDFGFVTVGLSPLARSVPPGSYPVEVALVSGTPVAVRLVLSDEPVASWHPAAFTDGSHHVSVDAANVAILDVGSLVTCEAQQVEASFKQHIGTLYAQPGTLFALTGADLDAAMVTSGYGDGGYPCYWGASSTGEVVALVVDFVVLAENIERLHVVPWQLGALDVPGQEMWISEDGDGFTIAHRGGHISRVRVLGPGGELLLDGHQLGTFVSEGTTSKTWPTTTPPPQGAVVEVTEYVGHRTI